MIAWTELLLLWLWFFFPYRRYRVDLLRYRLFVIRDDLFRQAAAGKISFDAVGYGMTRATINGMLRFAHDISLTQFVMLLWVDRDHRGATQYSEKYQSALSNLTPDQSDLIVSIRRRMHLAVLVHLATTSPLLAPLLLVSTVLLLGKRMKTWVTERLLTDKEPHMAAIDAAAVHEADIAGLVLA